MNSSSPRSGWRSLVFTLALLPFLTTSNQAQEWLEAPSEDRPLFPNLRVSAGATMVQGAEISSFSVIDRSSTGTDYAVAFRPETDMEFDAGPSIGIALGGGMRMPDWLHLEVETGFAVNRLGFRAEGVDFDGDLWQIPALVNATIPFKISESWEGFGGLGIGAVFGVLDLKETSVWSQVEDDPPGLIDVSGSHFTAAAMAQAFAGVRYRLNPSSALSLSYRFRGTTPPFWNRDFRSGSDEGDWELDLSRLYSHSVHLMYELKW